MKSDSRSSSSSATRLDADLRGAGRPGCRGRRRSAGRRRRHAAARPARRSGRGRRCRRSCPSSSTPVYLRALPLAALERGVGAGDVAGGGEEQRDGQLGGGDDVGGRRVDDHDAGLVAAGTSTLSRPTPARATTLSLRRGGDRLGVDLGGAADDHRVGVGERGEQGRRGRRRRSGALRSRAPSTSTAAGASSSAISTTGFIGPRSRRCDRPSDDGCRAAPRAGRCHGRQVPDYAPRRIVRGGP